MEAVKEVALGKIHESLGAKIIPFAGYNMPVRYSSDLEEHNVVREAVGLFDVSHMGEFIVSGKGALPLLQFVTSNDVAKLENGKIQYAYLPNDNGGIVDDLLVYKLDDDKYLLVVNASNIDKDWTWINSKNTFDAQLENVSDKYSLLALQGPKAVNVLNKIASLDLSELGYYTFTHCEVSGIENVFVSATGYTGSGGFEIMVPNEKVAMIWASLMEAGDEFGIKPIGLGARDTLRLEKGYCLYGNDIDDSTSPIEAGLAWVTKFSKSFNADAIIKDVKEKGATKKLVAFRMIDRGIPRSHYKLVNELGKELGVVTSGTMSPTLKEGIGMGYVNVEFLKSGEQLFVQVRKKYLKVEVVKLPFV